MNNATKRRQTLNIVFLNHLHDIRKDEVLIGVPHGSSPPDLIKLRRSGAGLKKNPCGTLPAGIREIRS
jgi:hypothetical protein